MAVMRTANLRKAIVTENTERSGLNVNLIKWPSLTISLAIVLTVTALVPNVLSLTIRMPAHCAGAEGSQSMVDALLSLN